MAKRIPITKIDSDVPIPSSVKYPFDKLDLNDSFVVPISKRASVASAATKYALRTDTKYIVRKIDEENIRVWRVK